MLFYKDVDDYKKGIEENIEWNKEQIKSIKEMIETRKEWRKWTSDAELIKSIQSGITHSENTIQAHQGFIAHSQKRYIELTGNRYGEQKLTLIRGGALQ